MKLWFWWWWTMMAGSAVTPGQRLRPPTEADPEIPATGPCGTGPSTCG